MLDRSEGRNQWRRTRRSILAMSGILLGQRCRASTGCRHVNVSMNVNTNVSMEMSTTVNMI